MARTIGRLTALKVSKAVQPGMYGDGGGLYLRVTRDGTKNWVFRFMLNGRPRWMGMGPLHTIGLAEARARAAECRRQRHDGIDPIDARRAERQQARLDAARTITFKECAEFGKARKTASRLRGRIEAVLDWAKVRGYRGGENPARWRGHIDKLLPARSKVRRVAHHAALLYAELQGFLVNLREQDSVAARALEFTILTAARTGETIGVRWSEFNIAGKVWTIPAARMKAGKEHRVPLSERVLAILSEMKPPGDAEKIGEKFVFPGGKAGKPLSNMAFLMLLRRMKRGDLTTHGFRSSFRDWAAERTNFASEVVEMALAHAVGDKVEAAYRRSDLFEKRRRLMDAWAEFCAKPKAEEANVVSLRA